VGAAAFLGSAFCLKPTLLIKLGALLGFGQDLRELVLQPPPLAIRPAVPAPVQVIRW